MKIVLVSYPSWRLRVNKEPFDHDSGSEDYPIGVLTLISTLRQESISTYFFDIDEELNKHFRYENLNKDAVMDWLLDELTALDAQVYGFSTINASYPFTLLLAKRIKQAMPLVSILLGGPQATATATATLQAFPFIDYILCGEADLSLPIFLKVKERNGDLSEVPNLIYRNRGNICRRERSDDTVPDLDSLPLPAYDLIDPRLVEKTVSLEAGRGCPFACRFCITSRHFSRKFRVKSPNRLVSDMKYMFHLYGSKSFNLIHDIFVFDRTWVLDFCHEVLDSSLPKDISWYCSARVDLVDEDLLSVMGSAGCKGIYYGIETGSQRIQKVIGKNINLQRVLPILATTRQFKIDCTASFITGFPEETFKDQEDTIDFLVETQQIKGVKAQLHVLSIYSGTPYFDEYRDILAFIPDSYPDAGLEPPLSKDELELIRSNPLITSNFWNYPHGLDVSRTKYLQLFINLSLMTDQVLMLLLKRKHESYICVFDQWEKWLTHQGISKKILHLMLRMPEKLEECLKYFLEFALDMGSRNAPEIHALVKLDLAKLDVSHTNLEVESKSGARPKLLSQVRLVKLKQNPYEIRNRLQIPIIDGNTVPQKKLAKSYFLVKKESKDCMRVYQISQIAGRVIEYCDGSSSIDSISSGVGAEMSNKIPSSLIKAGIFKLYDQGFITFL